MLDLYTYGLKRGYCLKRKGRLDYVRRDVDFFSFLQQRVDDSYVTVSGRRVYTPGSAFVRHVQVHAFFEQHHRAVRVAVQRGYVHESATVFRPLEYGSLEFVHQQFNNVGMSVFGRQMHRSSI